MVCSDLFPIEIYSPFKKGTCFLVFRWECFLSVMFFFPLPLLISKQGGKTKKYRSLCTPDDLLLFVATWEEGMATPGVGTRTQVNQ